MYQQINFTKCATDHALLWTDCRYFLQAVAQMDENWTLMKAGQLGSVTRGDWLAKNLESGMHKVLKVLLKG